MSKGDIENNVNLQPRVTQTVQRFEEHKRTEEIERRVQRKERRERRTRHEWSESGRHQGGGLNLLLLLFH